MWRVYYGRVRRLDDALVAVGFLAAVVLCLAFRYLPMIDLPQHYAMVSILAHHGDAAYGFAQRYTFDFVGRPYATVYLLGAGLAKLMPLGAAMRIVVATCTLAPLAGTYALLRAIDRPRIYALLALPFAFGALWHWGFLNFLLGTGLFLALLALVVHAAQRPSTKLRVAIGLLAILLLFTHVHGLFMLFGLAPLFAWAWRDQHTSTLGSLRTCLPLVPAALLAGFFVLTTWTHADGTWSYLYPGLSERIRRFPEFLGAGVRAPWPAISLAVFAGLLIGLVILGGRKAAPRGRQLVVLGFALVSQIAFYLALPLNTKTATFLSARHAILCIVFALLLAPALAGGRLAIARAAVVAFAAVALVVVGVHLRRFDAEARDYDGILAHAQPNRRVVSLIFDPRSPTTHPFVFPYLHFAAYYQAAYGGDLSRSFALVWNVPIRYRADYPRYAIDERIEFNPRAFSLERDLPHFDYVLTRSPRPIVFPPQAGLTRVAASGMWTLWENPSAVE